ncbi:MAG: hypothetical protein JWQ74_2285 [Marmoricola sp.]|nr:hypothetical protein [Marmoricola sp.]
MSIEVRPGGSRFVTETEGRTTLHSFSFGSFYDPANTGFAAMLAHNDEHLPAGTGYPDHPHHDTEIVTWVLEGALRHTGSDGSALVLGPGEILRTSAGSGIVHSELTEPGVTTRFVQTWLRPDVPGAEPSTATAQIGTPTTLTEVVGPAGAVRVGTTGARLHLASSGPGSLLLPEAPRAHVFVAAGCVEIGDRLLPAGDAARLHGEAGRALLVPESAVLAVWSFA